MSVIVDPALRRWVAAVADALIPASGQMPSAGEVGAGDAQLDVVLAARPDLLAGLEQARQLAGPAAPDAVLSALPEQSPARDALLLVVAGGYYASPVVNRLLGYSGQTPEPVRADLYPAYVEEGLLDRVVSRGPTYRPTVPSAPPDASTVGATPGQERQASRPPLRPDSAPPHPVTP